MKYVFMMSAAAIAVAGVATGQEVVPEGEERLELVTVTGLRPVPVEDVTTSVTVLSTEALEVRDAPFLADQLRTVPGAAVSRNGSAGGLTQLRLRGGEANHTLVLINGVEVSDPVTGETDFGLLSGLRPSSVEVLRGEQSGLYGSDAIGGVVNIVTGGSDGLSALLEGGSFDTLRSEAAFGAGFARGGFDVAFSGFSADGVDTSGLKGEEDGTETLSALFTGDYELGVGFVITGLARFAQGEAQIDSDTDFDGLLNDIDRLGEYQQVTLGASLQGETAGIDHLFRVSLNTVERENFTAGVFTNRSEGERTKVSYSPAIEIEQAGGVFTLSGLVDWEQEDYTARDDEFGGFTNQDQSFETLGIGGEVRADVGALDVSASLRFDDNDGRFDDAMTGRIGAAYTTDQAGRFRASVGTGVKNPTFTELFGFFPGSFVGNPDLVPEESTSWEIGWDKSFGDLDFSATYFEAELEDEIFTSFNPDFTSTARNRDGTSERSGFEFGLTWDATNALNINAQATLIDSSAEDGSDEIRVPRETASLAFDYRPDTWKGGRFGLAFDYVGSQDDFDFGRFPARRVELDPYLLASATAEIPLRDRLSLTLRGENLFDQNVVDVFGYESTGLGVFVGLKLRGK